MARPEGLEPPTLWFEARYSIQLSYGRVIVDYQFLAKSLQCSLCLAAICQFLHSTARVYSLAASAISGFVIGLWFRLTR